MIFLITLLVSQLSFAAAPHYRVPGDTTSTPETCVTRETFANGEDRSVTDEHRVTYWTDILSDPVHFYSLTVSKDGRREVYTETVELEIDRLYTRRRVVTETWTKGSRGWTKASATTEQTVRKVPGAYVQIEETTNGQTYRWEVRTRADGDDSLSEKTSLNPEVFGAASHVVSCRFHVGSVRP